MDENIQVAAVYMDGSVHIYGPVVQSKKRTWPRLFIRAIKFSTYGQALQFAYEFEQKQKQPSKQ